MKIINFILRIKKNSDIQKSDNQKSVVLPKVCLKGRMQGSSEGDFHMHSTMVLVPESTMFTWLFYLSSTPQVWIAKLLQCPF